MLIKENEQHASCSVTTTQNSRFAFLKVSIVLGVTRLI